MLPPHHAFLALALGVLAPVAAAQPVSSPDESSPPEEAELRRRGGHFLTPRQEANLTHWGYPYVLDEYEFHITLTGKINEGQESSLLFPLNTYFGALLLDGLAIDSLCVCRQPVTPDEKRASRYASPFTVVAQFPLEGTWEKGGA